MSATAKRVRNFGPFFAALAACGVLYAAPGLDPKLRIRQADYYVREFEREVARQRGGE